MPRTQKKIKVDGKSQKIFFYILFCKKKKYPDNKESAKSNEK